jgi:hypothetical protein
MQGKKSSYEIDLPFVNKKKYERDLLAALGDMKGKENHLFYFFFNAGL